MDKVIEELMKNREPVHEKCLGIGFTEEEVPFLKLTQCPRVDPTLVYEIIDEETGEVDPEVPPVESASDPNCRCKAYVKPSLWWRPGFRCPLGDHFRPDLQVETKKGRVGQQKQKRRR